MIVIELLTSCNAEHKEKQVNKETSDAIMIDDPISNMQYSKNFGAKHFPPHYMTSERLVIQTLQEGVSLERQRTLQLKYSLTMEVPRVLRERMLTLFISKKHLYWIVAAEL